jgi:sugar phosphate isomerase/epimerase
MVDRRDFLASMTALALGGISAPGRTARRPTTPPVHLGIQLYTLRDLLQADPEGTLGALARDGYREVELAGTYGRPAAEFRAILDRVGLKAPSGHVDIPAVTSKIDQTIADAKTLGHHFVVVPWLPEDARTADGYARMAETFNRAGERMKQAGLALGYHNHWFEFADLDGSRCGYDILLEKTDPRLVTMELDLFWIRKGGRDAMAYFARYPHRFQLVHVKDMANDGAMVDVGQGAIDWPHLLTTARKAGVRYFFVEHDEAGDPLAFARNSLAYMQRLRL